MTIHFDPYPYTDRCQDLLKRGEHILLGLSPFNSYYTSPRVECIIAWAAAHFQKIDVLIPGYEAAYTLTAVGVRPLDAVRRTCRAIKKLRSAALRGLQQVGVSYPEHRVHVWTQLTNRSTYIALREQIKANYEISSIVSKMCRSIATMALQGINGVVPTDQQIDEAVSYPIAELPFLMDSPAIFETDSTVFAYHRRFSGWETVITGHIPELKPSFKQGFIVLKEAIEDSNYSQPELANYEVSTT